MLVNTFSDLFLKIRFHGCLAAFAEVYYTVYHNKLQAIILKFFHIPLFLTMEESQK
jgi:hypothetical protein